MASLEHLEIDSIYSDSASVSLPPSALQSPFQSPTRTKMTTPQIQVQPTTPDLFQSTLLRVPLPSFRATDEDTDASASEGETVSGSPKRVCGVAGGEPEVPTRPKSVLSIFGHSLSRAKSALSRISINSTRLQNIPSKMKTRILGFTDRAKEKRRDEDQQDLYSSCSSSVADPEASLHSAEIKRELEEESPAGSDSETSENGVAAGEKRCGFRCSRTMTHKLRNCRLTCDYFFDPGGKDCFLQ